MLEDFYRGKKVLVTGHAGFKGSWLVMLLHKLGAKIYGYSLLPKSNPRLYELCGISSLLDGELIADILNKESLNAFVKESRPQIVLHLAAQPLVKQSYLDPANTYLVNVMGTLNVLEAARGCDSVKSLVNVTTDKCYENKEDGRPFKEHESMGGYDMYSSSKACSEILSASYRRSFLNGDHPPYLLATARAGNVIGGGDFSEDRLIPDCIRALKQGQPVLLRHPGSVRPWQHVLEPVRAYLILAKRLFEGDASCAGPFNLGPNPEDILSAGQVAEEIIKQWGSCAKIENTESCFHEANLLRLDIGKAQEMLNVSPVLNAHEAVALTVQWYKQWAAGKDNLMDFSLGQIEGFLNRADGHAKI